MRLALTAVAALSFSMPLMAADPIVGTWKLNLEKSKLSYSLQSYLLKIEETAPSTYRTVVDIVWTCRAF
jgi:hypothetical protein